MKYKQEEEIKKLKMLKDKNLAFVYSNGVIGSYRDGIDPKTARPEYMKWVYRNLENIRDAIRIYMDANAKDYPYEYNQQLRKKHNGKYEKGVAEKEIVRGIMNYQRELKKTVKTRPGLVQDDDVIKNAERVFDIIDYEVPTFCLKKNSGFVSGRKIDAVGRDSSGNRLYIYEAKKNKSPETLLRCLMEAFSYSLFVNRERFKESFGVGQNATMVLSPLIFKDSKPYEDLEANLKDKDERQIFRELLQKMKEVADVDIEFTVVRKEDFIRNGAPIFPKNGKEFDTKWLD